MNQPAIDRRPHHEICGETCGHDHGTGGPVVECFCSRPKEHEGPHDWPNCSVEHPYYLLCPNSPHRNKQHEWLFGGTCAFCGCLMPKAMFADRICKKLERVSRRPPSI